MITKVKLSGITCHACEKIIAKRLKTINNINEVQVNIKEGEVTIFASRPVSIDEVTQVLQGTHYKVINQRQ